MSRNSVRSTPMLSPRDAEETVRIPKLRPLPRLWRTPPNRADTDKGSDNKRGLPDQRTAPPPPRAEIGDPIGETSDPFDLGEVQDRERSEQGLRVRVLMVLIALGALMFAAGGLAVLSPLLTPDPGPTALVVPDVVPRVHPASEPDVLPDFQIIEVQPNHIAEPEVPAAPQLAPTTVRVADGSHFTAVSLACDGQSAIRMNLLGGEATFVDVPVDGSCLVRFLGGQGGKGFKTHGGETLSCSFGAVPRCLP